jgi:hypothetical protein
VALTEQINNEQTENGKTKVNDCKQKVTGQYNFKQKITVQSVLTDYGFSDTISKTLKFSWQRQPVLPVSSNAQCKPKS